MSRVLPRQVTSRIDPSHPIINSLGRVFGGFLPGKRTAEKATKAAIKHPEQLVKGYLPRCDVVDEKLCDDLVQYLAPTLEQHKGCTLVDINPGACLWSRKLHDFLQPKRHVLMEPDERYLKPFIQPLLDLPGSRYLYSPIAGLHATDMAKNHRLAVASEELDFEPFAAHEDLERRELRTDILLTGNLSRRYREVLRSGNASPQCDFLLQQLTWASLSNSLFFRNGPVRQLWWFPELSKRNILPRRPQHKSSHNVGLLVGADITEVAGTRQVHASAKKADEIVENAYDTHPSMTHLNTKIVQERMAAASIVVPVGRDIVAPVPSNTEVQDPEPKSPLEIRHQIIHRALVEEPAKVEARMEEVFDVVKKSKKVINKDKADKMFQELTSTQEYPQCDPITRDSTFITMKRTTVWDPTRLGASLHRLSKFMDLQLRIINLEAHIKHFEEQGEDVREAIARVIAVDKDFRRRLDDFYGSKTHEEHLETLVQDQLMLFSTPKQLAPNRKPYEALKAKTEDFWPKVDMCLIDVVPSSRDMSVPGIADRASACKTAQELIKYLFLRGDSFLTDALDRIAPNAAQDLIPMCPSFSDPRKGGRLNVGALKIKMINEQMVEELVKAWYEWPFAPSFHELALASGGGGEESGFAKGELEDE